MSDTSKASRRKFLKAVPTAVAGAVAARAYAQGPPQNTGPVTADVIRAAETIDGVQFTSEEAAAAAQAANQNLAAFNRLRQIDIPQDTEPAYIFKPSLPGKEPKGPATPGAPIKYTKPPLTLKRPANLDEVAYWPVTHLAALLERKLVTSTELTNMYLARLKRYQPSLLFYVTLTEELALKQAADADREIKTGKYRGPLHGIPWGAKDLFATKGINTTWGAEPYVDQILDYDATIVERLQAAGAVLVAKLTLGALAQGDRWFGGRTNNPWNVQEGSSGSSAGPGSATAAGCVAFAIGTETQGSILSPSSINGLVGLRPTYGRVSRYGAMALSTTMDKIGPMCRYVEDAALVFNAIYGPDKRDASVADAAFRWSPDAPLSGYKIGYLRNAFEGGGRGRGAGAAGAPGGAAGAGAGRAVATAGGAGAAGAAAGAGAAGAGAAAAGAGRGRGAGGGGGGRQPLSQEQLQDVLNTYRKLGAQVDAVDPPDGTIAQAIGFILQVESAASFDDITRSGDINTVATGTSRSTWPNTFRQGRFVPAVEYIRAMRARTLLMRQMDEYMSKYDAILSPQDSMSTITNRTGHPAVSVKAGLVDGTPRPLIITGRLYEEATILRIALAYEQATEWKDKHPTLTA
jgi:Asp-tRNA(Asn)/Glu-tRNA(Gln) amidotransferase A subunit family amidase